VVRASARTSTCCHFIGRKVGTHCSQRPDLPYFLVVVPTGNVQESRHRSQLEASGGRVLVLEVSHGPRGKRRGHEGRGTRSTFAATRSLSRRGMLVKGAAGKVKNPSSLPLAATATSSRFGCACLARRSLRGVPWRSPPPTIRTATGRSTFRCVRGVGSNMDRAPRKKIGHLMLGLSVDVASRQLVAVCLTILYRYSTNQANVPGSYTVDAKVLMWNGKGRTYEIEQSCTKARVGRMPSSIRSKYPLHAGFQAFKMVYPEQTCCEVS
jgi:hypothetical protein